jgi:glycosyltransferase involved in cell wall biosynthesis
MTHGPDHAQRYLPQLLVGVASAKIDETGNSAHEFVTFYRDVLFWCAYIIMPVTSEHDVPLISIAMPVLNCERTLACALRGTILQTYGNWELLLIDDGSSDDTIRVAESFCDPRIRLFHDGRQMGLPARLNQAIQLARGEYLARMDGDDVSFPERLGTQLEYLRAHTEIDLVGASMAVFKGTGELLGVRPCSCTHEEICRRPWAHFTLGHPTWMGRTEWFRLHLYREDAVRMEDQDLLLRSWQDSRFAGIPEILVGFREDSLTLRKMLTGRLNYCRALVRQARITGRYCYWLRGVVAHAGKALVDVAAVATGLNYRVLRSRAQAAPPQDVAIAWREFWRTLQPK